MSADIRDQNAECLRRMKHYRLPDGGRQWEVVQTERTDHNTVHMLARDGTDYVVFSFWLLSDLTKHFPRDKFAHGEEQGWELFRELTDADHRPRLESCHG